MKRSDRAGSMDRFCSLVKKAGGVPVFAHPGAADYADLSAFRAMLNAALEQGIGGVECYYPSHSAEITEACLDFCHKNDLCITGGADCHGSYDPSPGFTIGALKIPIDRLDLRGIC